MISYQPSNATYTVYKWPHYYQNLLNRIIIYIDYILWVNIKIQTNKTYDPLQIYPATD